MQGIRGLFLEVSQQQGCIATLFLTPEPAAEGGNGDPQPPQGEACTHAALQECGAAVEDHVDRDRSDLAFRSWGQPRKAATGNGLLGIVQDDPGAVRVSPGPCAVAPPAVRSVGSDPIASAARVCTPVGAPMGEPTLDEDHPSLWDDVAPDQMDFPVDHLVRAAYLA